VRDRAMMSMTLDGRRAAARCVGEVGRPRGGPGLTKVEHLHACARGAAGTRPPRAASATSHGSERARVAIGLGTCSEDSLQDSVEFGRTGSKAVIRASRPSVSHTAFRETLPVGPRGFLPPSVSKLKSDSMISGALREPALAAQNLTQTLFTGR